MNKKEIIPKPYGYTTMLRLAWVDISIFYISIVHSLNSGNWDIYFDEQYPISTLWTSILIVYDLFVITWTESLKRKKSQKYLDQIRIYLVISLFMSVLECSEQIYKDYHALQEWFFFYVVYFLVHIGILIYWNNPIHDRYMKSGS